MMDAYGDFQTIRCRRIEDGIFRVEIGQPPLNLLTQDVRRELGDVFLSLQRDPQVRVILFGGADGHFCAGADLKEFPLRFDPQTARAHGENAHRMILALRALNKPTIGVLNGHCMGGGLELALGCAFRIASSGATFALPEIKRGVWPGTGGIFLLQRLIGSQQARRLLLTGDAIDSLHAEHIGLVDQVAAPDDLQSCVMAFARRLAAQPTGSVAAISDLLDKRHVEAFQAHLRYELELFVQAYQRPEAREGNQAFFEKRAPRWQHG